MVTFDRVEPALLTMFDISTLPLSRFRAADPGERDSFDEYEREKPGPRLGDAWAVGGTGLPANVLLCEGRKAGTSLPRDVDKDSFACVASVDS